MKFLFHKIIKPAFFLLLFALILLYPKQSLYYAANGLRLWFDRMVPTLFPFMLLSTLMIRQNLTEGFAGSIHPIAGRLYRMSRSCVYCLLLGFLCGFPMGARTIAEMYERKQLTKREAEFLLAFCNNIGPVYYISFFLPVTGLSKGNLGELLLLLFGMYGIPLVYGVFVRYTGFLLPKGQFLTESGRLPEQQQESFQKSLDYAMQSAIAGITTLGGYMILFNLLNLLPHAIFQLFSISGQGLFSALINCMLEITSGIMRLKDSAPLAALILLPIGGLSCLAQTRSMIQNTDLSMGRHFLHKTV
ncbi:MAG: hypothetical protein K2G20_04275, partial [Lachnospiraceae bacterium]|nr:hypothetical protein [Lachnospiraceae bacterium]